MSVPERDLQSKLDEMEADLNHSADSNPIENLKSVIPDLEINPSPQVRGWIDRGKSVFNSLPTFGKVAVAIGGVWLGFSIVGAVLHVVSSVVSIAAVGFVLYLGYRLFNSSSESE